MKKTTDNKDQEVRVGDYLFINQFSGNVGDSRNMKSTVLKVNGKDEHGTFSVEYSVGWPASCHPDIISGKNGWWFSLSNHYTFKIPQRLVDARDKNGIRLFVQLAGFDVDVNHIEFNEDD